MTEQNAPSEPKEHPPSQDHLHLWLSGAVFGALLLLILFEKVPDKTLPEVFWVCHAGSFVLGLGLLFRSPVITGIGLLSHVGFGSIGFLLDVLFVSGKSVVSWLSHTISPVAGWIAIRRWGGLPRFAPLHTWAFILSLMLFCYLFTPPAMNINVVHDPWKPFKPYFSTLFTYNLFNSFVALFLVSTITFIFQKPLKWSWKKNKM